MKKVLTQICFEEMKGTHIGRVMLQNYYHTSECGGRICSATLHDDFQNRYLLQKINTLREGLSLPPLSVGKCTPEVV